MIPGSISAFCLWPSVVSDSDFILVVGITPVPLPDGKIIG